MKIAFHGAARTVTGSKHMIGLKNGKKVLLDCGMFQGMGKDTDALNREFGFDASSVDVMILSHAHIDHSGLIPRLFKQGFSGKIFCTDATRQLSTLLLEDSAEIQESDSKYQNKGSRAQGAPLVQPLYTMEDAINCMGLFVEQPYGQWFPVTDGVEAMFTDAGHIIGSACVHVRVTENGVMQQLTFSGDVGRYRDVILKSPQTFPQSDYIVMESTYGNSLHEDVHTSLDILLQWIQRICIQKKGKLIVPAFSLGRTQEILYALNQLELENRLPRLDYFLDSPLSTSITGVIKNYPQYFNKTIQKVMESDSDPFMFNGLHYIKSVDESKMLNYRNEPCVIISASGMAEAGRVKHHISNNIENSHNGILMTGYCEPNSLGGRLLAGAKEVGIFGVQHEVHAEIGAIKSMSAHGDYEDLSQWLACQDPQKVKKLFLVHGEYDVQIAFKNRLVKKGFVDVEIPERHYEIGLG
ncbi:MAG: MBL fold metallo-hydrolase RNA specificity domain-containing protein [Flavisolibacter sp.]